MSVSLESLMREQMAAPSRAPVAVQLLLFVAIGGGAALAFALVSAAAVTAFHTSPAWLVSALCYAAFIVPVYLLQRRFSFGSSAEHRRALPRYVLVQLGNLALATLFSWLVYGVGGLPTLGAALIVTILTAGISFLILRRWAFGAA